MFDHPGRHEAEPYRLHVLGSRELWSPDGTRVSSVLAQPKRLCLLTYLALAPAPVSRSTLAALFWPESDEAKSRNSLSQAVFYLRRSTAKGVVPGYEGDRLWVPPDRLWCDARSLMRGDPTAAGSATGDLIEGWNADDSQPLQEWLDATRRELRQRAAAAPPAPTNGSAPSGVGALAHGVGPRDGPGPGVRPAPGSTEDRGARARATPQRASDTPAQTAGGARWLVALAFLVALGVAWWVWRPGDTPPASAAGAGPPVPGQLRSGPTLVITSPRWAASEEIPPGLAEAIVAEVINRLSDLESLSIGTVERPDVTRALSAIGQDAGVDLTLDFVLTLTSHEIRATARLTGRDGFTEDSTSPRLAYATLAELLIAGPDSIAASVARMVRDELDQSGGVRR